jgi:hypothetical protein
VEDFAVVPVCVFAAPEVCPEPPVCEEAADFAAGFAGFAAGVEPSVAGGVVDGFVVGVCCAAAVPAKIMVAANTLIAMLGSFRMDLVSHWFGMCANGVIRDWSVVVRELGRGAVQILLSDP